MGEFSLIDQAKNLWNFHCLKSNPLPADFVFVACSSQTETASTASNLYKNGFAKTIIFSGGFGYRSKLTFTKPEADYFKDIALSLGIPESAIITENESVNLLDNITKCRPIVSKLLPNAKSGLAVSNPWVSRRFLAHLEIKWPEIKFLPVIPDHDFDYYYKKSGDDLISILVKDLNTIIKYGGTDLTKQKISDKVMVSLRLLTGLGYPKVITQP